MWDEVLKDLAKSQRDAAGVIETRWLPPVLPGAESAAEQPSVRSRAARNKGPAHTVLPSKQELDVVIGKLSRAGLAEGLWLQVRRLMRRHFEFAELSGDSYFAVRTLHNLGYRLLRLAPDQGQIQELHSWTLRSIELEPHNPYVWGLWARVLTASGQPETALAVRWETIRRFPTDAVLRNELAEELRGNGQSAIAEHLLRQTMRDFPRDKVCRVALAGLWRESGRIDKAEALLRETDRSRLSGA